MLSSIFYINIIIGFILFGLLFALATPIAIFFENNKLVSLLQITAVLFIITTLSLVQKSLLEKAMLFKRLIVIETVALTFSSILGIALAILGQGVYSLIIMFLSNSIILTIGLWINSHWRPSLSFSFEDINKILKYSLNLTGFGFINYFARQADQFLIGKMIGSNALGVYSLAYKIMLYPLHNLSAMFGRVLFPAFSEVKHDTVRFKSIYLKLIKYTAAITFPLMMGVLATADNFVNVVFGPQWSQMSSLLVILAPIGLIQAIVTTVGNIYLAKGTTNIMFKIGAVSAIVTVISFIIGIPFGINGVAAFYGVANLIVLYPNLKVAWKQINLGIIEGIKHLAPFFISACIMAAFVFISGELLSLLDIRKIIILVCQVLFGVVIYIFSTYILFPKSIKEIWSEINFIIRMSPYR
jgi:O-antigen/teichoic acid export membrane protein